MMVTGWGGGGVLYAYNVEFNTETTRTHPGPDRLRPVIISTRIVFLIASRKGVVSLTRTWRHDRVHCMKRRVAIQYQGAFRDTA